MGCCRSEGHEPWFHIRQNKHHRWSLDEGQVEQYHLGAALHPHIRWWEAMDVPRKAIQFVEVAELVLTSLVCEDLAHNDDIAQLIRSVGPTVVVNVLLDGPQLTSRWTARYASVLADDPGSAVLTLTSYGMVERSRPAGRDASRVIALWKDPTRGVREIPLEPGAHGVLLTVCMDRATRYSADRRWPVDNSTSCYGVAVHQVRASSVGSGPPQSPPPTTSTAPVLELDELTILTAWAEGVSEVAAYAPERIDRLLAAAGPGATWRAELGLPEPSPRLADAIESLGRVARAAPLPAGASSFDALLTAAKQDHPAKATLDQVVRHALLSHARGTADQATNPNHRDPLRKSPPRPPDACRGTGPLGRCLTSFDRAFIAAPPVVPRWAVGVTAAIGSAQLHVLSLEPLDLRGLLAWSGRHAGRRRSPPDEPTCAASPTRPPLWPRPIRSPPTATGTRTDPPRPSAPPEPSAPAKTCRDLT